MKAEKIAIFGGSFDPPHYAHYDIVKNLERSFDRVIVVPSYISPFKADADASDARARLAICRKFFTSQKTEVLAREITRKGISYSVDTAAFLAKKHAGAALTWVIGSEEVNKLDRWHDIDRLCKLVSFLVVPRPGFTPDAATVKALKKRGVKLKLARFVGLDVSSTEIKLDIAFGRQNKLMPAIVYDAVTKKGMFDPYGKYVDALYTYELSDKRLSHTYGVAVRGAELAKQFGYSVHDAVVACILHDIAKSADPAKYIGKVDTMGFPAPTVHAPIGAYIAKRDFSVSPEIEHAIRYHATGSADIGLLDEIVYIADKTEAGRNYNEVYYFRYLCGVDKDIAMYCMLNAVSDYKGNLPCEMTAAAIEHYKKLIAGKEIPEMPPRDKRPARTHDTLPAVRAKSELGEIKTKSLRAVPDKSVAHMRDKSVAHMRDKSVAEVPDKSLRAVPEKRAELMPGKVSTDFTDAELADVIAAELDLHKAHDIDIIDVTGKTIVADSFVICSAGSSTAVKALMGYVEDKVTKTFGLDPFRRDVDKEWIALDYGGVIVHIFTDKTREFYNIERLWSDGTNVKRI